MRWSHTSIVPDDDELVSVPFLSESASRSGSLGGASSYRRWPSPTPINPRRRNTKLFCRLGGNTKQGSVESQEAGFLPGPSAIRYAISLSHRSSSHFSDRLFFYPRPIMAKVNQPCCQNLRGRSSRASFSKHHLSHRQSNSPRRSQKRLNCRTADLLR
jgi:hypothetical protein